MTPSQPAATGRTIIVSCRWGRTATTNGGTHHDCYFWAIKGGTPVHFGCGGLGDDSLQYFYIHPGTSGTHYILAYCGTAGDYLDVHCTTEDGSQAVYNNTQVDVSGEEIAECGTHIFGNNSDQQTVGDAGSGNYVQGRGSSGSWTVRSFITEPDPCDNVTGSGQYSYHQDLDGSGNMQVARIYDTRNTS